MEPNAKLNQEPDMTRPLVVTNTTVYPGAHQAVRRAIDIVIEDRRISAIEPTGTIPINPGTWQVLDGTHFITMPGLVNAHTHSNESFEMGCYDAMPLELWLLFKYPPGAIRPISLRWHYLRTMLLAIDNVRSGVTAVQDDLINPAFESDALDGSASAYRDIGLKATITVSMGDRSLSAPLPWLRDIMPAEQLAELDRQAPPSADAHFELFERHFERWHGSADNRLRIIPGPIGPQWCTDALLVRADAIARERGLSVHTHTLESKLHAIEAAQLYGCTLVEYLDRLGVLSPRLTLNHAIWLTDDDLRRLATNGCHVTHNPASNLKLGSGIARVPEMLRLGVNVALGTDGTSTADRSDMFRSLGLAAMIHRVGSLDCDQWPTAEDAFAMATVAGARSAGLDSGVLAPGRPADLVLLNRDDFAFIGTDSIAARLAFAANSDCVDTVIVNGELIMQGRRLLRVNEALLRREILAAAAQYLEQHVYPGHANSRRFEPWFRQMLRRAITEPVAAPVEALRLRPPRLQPARGM